MSTDKKPFVVTLRENYDNTYIVWAANEEEAEERIQRAYDNDEVYFDWDNFSGTEVFTKPLEGPCPKWLSVLNPKDAPDNEENNNG